MFPNISIDQTRKKHKILTIDINYLKSRAEAYRTSCHVIIRENRAKYPSFDWVALEEYHLYY